MASGNVLATSFFWTDNDLWTHCNNHHECLMEDILLREQIIAAGYKSTINIFGIQHEVEAAGVATPDELVRLSGLREQMRQYGPHRNQGITQTHEEYCLRIRNHAAVCCQYARLIRMVFTYRVLHRTAAAAAAAADTDDMPGLV